MLKSIRNDEVDIIVWEDIDRIALDGEDIVWLGKKLRYSNVLLHMLTEGEIDDIKFAVAGIGIGPILSCE